MNKLQVAETLGCSTRQVEKYVQDGRLTKPVYVRGKRGKEAKYDPADVERLKAETERERLEVVGHAPESNALAMRAGAGLSRLAPDEFVAMVAASVSSAVSAALRTDGSAPPHEWLTRSQAADWLGLPRRRIDAALAGDKARSDGRSVRVIGNGRGERINAFDLRDYMRKL